MDTLRDLMRTGDECMRWAAHADSLQQPEMALRLRSIGFDLWVRAALDGREEAAPRSLDMPRRRTLRDQSLRLARNGLIAAAVAASVLALEAGVTAEAMRRGFLHTVRDDGVAHATVRVSDAPAPPRMRLPTPAQLSLR